LIYNIIPLLNQIGDLMRGKPQRVQAYHVRHGSAKIAISDTR